MEIKDAEFAKEWFGERRRCFETHDGAGQTCGNLKWVNSKTLEELYFTSATVACGQRSAYPNNVVYLVILPAWRTSGEVAPVDGYQKMAPGSVSG